MSSISAEKMSELVASGRGASALFDAAFEAARSELTENDETLELMSSSLHTIAALSAETLVAKATRISPKGATQRICRVVLSQARPNNTRKTQIAEGMLSFKVSEVQSAEHAKDAPKTLEQPEQSFSSTAEMRRRQIFDAACIVIAKHGFGNATMRAIASEAGMSVPLMYKYIKDKDDILYLITTVSMKDLFAHFDSEDFLAKEPAENITLAVDKYLDYIDHNRPYINLVYSETRSLSAENRERVFETETSLIKRWQAILDDGIQRNVFKEMNTELMANAIYFLCTLWSLRYWSIGHIDKTVVHKELKDFILKGLSK